MKKIVIVKIKLIVAILLLLDSGICLFDYKLNDCINPWFTPIVCGEDAILYYYIYIVIFVLSIVLIITSFTSGKNLKNTKADDRVKSKGRK